MTREILSRLQRDYHSEVAALGVHQLHCPKEPVFPFRVYGCGGWSEAAQLLPQILADWEANVVVTLSDPWMVDKVAHVMSSHRAVWIGYISIDATPLPAAWRTLLQQMNRVVCYSQFAQEALRDAKVTPEPLVIYPGVDAKIFRPVMRTRRRKRNTTAQPFIVGTVARNQFRKQLPLLMKAFHKFAVDKTSVHLHLHADPYDPLGGNLVDLRDRLELQGLCSFGSKAGVFDGIPDAEMSALYASMDVFALPTMGEGFGLPILEAMSCGVPVIATDCSAVTELVQGRGELLRVKEWLTVGPYNIEQAIADTDHLVELLNKLYENPELRAEYGRKGREFAETMTWDKCAEQWAQLLDEVAAELPQRSKVSRSAAVPSTPLWQQGPIRIEPFERVVTSEGEGRKRAGRDAPPLMPKMTRNKTLQVVWRSPILDASGYGDEARSFVLPLSRRLQHLRLDDVDWLPQQVPLEKEEHQTLERLRRTRLTPPFLEVVHQMPHLFKRNELAYYRIGRTMFELIGLPDFWVEECNAMNEVWVPSTFCLELFADSGVVRNKLRLMPGGIDTRLFSPGTGHRAQGKGQWSVVSGQVSRRADVPQAQRVGHTDRSLCPRVHP